MGFENKDVLGNTIEAQAKETRENYKSSKG